MNHYQVIAEVNEKYSEWIEELGDDSPGFIISILANQIVNLKNEKDYYKKRVDHYMSRTIP